MRYILDDLGYIEAVGSHLMECNNKTCTEYTGAIPGGYESLEEWRMRANIRAWKIVDGNLEFDPDRDLELRYEQLDTNDEIVITSIPKAPYREGEWELIDKEFAPVIGGASGFTHYTTNVSSSASKWSRAGHTITLNTELTTKKAIADTPLKLGDWQLATLGITAFPHVCSFMLWGDEAQSIAFVKLTTAGVLNSADQIPDSQINPSRYLEGVLTVTIPHTLMLDEACNKFYWKRKKEVE